MPGPPLRGLRGQAWFSWEIVRKIRRSSLAKRGDLPREWLSADLGGNYGIPSDEIRPQGNRSVNARFKNLFPHARHGFRDLLRWKLRGSTRPGQSEPFSAPIHAENLSRQGDDGATWIGHASFLLRLEGRVLLVDPVFSDHCAPFRIPGLQRTAPPGVSWSEAARAEGVLITHNHYDHLDRPTISKLPGAIQFFVPTGVGRWMERVGKRNIREFGWWESWTWNGWKVTAVPAQHFSSRTLWDRNKTLWCGWILETEKKRIYLAGDTGYCPVFREIGDRFGPMDLAIIPIGAYEPRWFMKPMHVSPEEAIQIHLDTRARKSVASHWGTFRLTDEPLGEPPVRLRAGLEAAKLTVGEFVVPKIGETILF